MKQIIFALIIGAAIIQSCSEFSGIIIENNERTKVIMTGSDKALVVKTGELQSAEPIQFKFPIDSIRRSMWFDYYHEYPDESIIIYNFCISKTNKQPIDSSIDAAVKRVLKKYNQPENNSWKYDPSYISLKKRIPELCFYRKYYYEGTLDTTCVVNLSFDIDLYYLEFKIHVSDYNDEKRRQLDDILNSIELVKEE